MGKDFILPSTGKGKEGSNEPCGSRTDSNEIASTLFSLCFFPTRTNCVADVHPRM